MKLNYTLQADCFAWFDPKKNTSGIVAGGIALANQIGLQICKFATLKA